jgi:NAD(P)-dependent dehydrogenase (short-subunit alcohol dehydrogenase family)
MTRAIIVGANSGIARAIIEQLLNGDVVEHVTAISRSSNFDLQSRFASRMQWIRCNYSEASIKTVCANLASDTNEFSHVIICNGVLHTGQLGPEKRFEDITAAKLETVLQANTIIPMLWLASLLPALKGALNCSVAIFSARVGSITDNRSGGWYSYRASKSALNMLIKTASIEYQRRASNVKLLAFHPGTTDTELSKPFQGPVPEGKLFTPDFVASSLLEIMGNLDRDSGAEFLDWAGKPVPW